MRHTELSRSTASFDDVVRYLKQTGQTVRDDGASAHQRLMTDGVTFAIMRRISRESVYTARTIDLAAAALRRALTELDPQWVLLPHVDRLDRLSLKVFARCVLMHTDLNGFEWHWWSTSDPLVPVEDGAGHFVQCRSEFLRTVARLVRPTLRRVGPIFPIKKPPQQQESLGQASVALVLQNYDACLSWCEGLMRLDDDAVEPRRILGLALLNVTKFEYAIDVWQSAVARRPTTAQSAQLSYLQGLVLAKRQHDLRRSDEHYIAGMATLDAASGPSDEDLALERAWLHNGLALNNAIRWRREPDKTSYYHAAFNTIQTAFHLVKGELTAPRTYLRYNLLANTAFLMEMAGEYERAIAVFRRAFDIDRILAHPSANSRMRSTLNYRIALLHSKAGNPRKALAHFDTAAASERDFGLWYTQERIERARGAVAFEAENLEAAVRYFASGLELSLANRSAEGAIENGRGCIQSLLASGAYDDARALHDRLVSEEGIALTGTAAPSSEQLMAVAINPPSPKLPAYIPEIDLEGAPSIDLNRFLGDAMRRESVSAASAWAG